MSTYDNNTVIKFKFGVLKEKFLIKFIRKKIFTLHLTKI